MKRYKLGVVIFSIIVLALILVSGLALGEELTREQIIEGAKKEGELMYYFGGDLSRHKEIVEKFKKKYPFIDVHIWQASHSKIYQRLQLENRLGKVKADFICTNNPLYFVYLKDAGMLLYYLSPEDKHYRHLLDMEKIGFPYDPGYWTPIRINLSVFVYRTDKWSREDAPKSWKDLLDPKYKGEIVFSDPRFGEGAKFTFYGLKEQFGIDYLKGLAKNDPMFTSGGGSTQTKLVMGERSIAILGTQRIMRAMIVDKAPVDFFVPEEGGPLSLKSVAILSDALHPNCARLFMDHFLSKEIAEFNRDNGYNVGARDDFVPKENPITLKTYKKIWPLSPDKFSKEIRGLLREFVNIFGL